MEQKISSNIFKDTILTRFVVCYPPVLVSATARFFQPLYKNNLVTTSSSQTFASAQYAKMLLKEVILYKFSGSYLSLGVLVE